MKTSIIIGAMLLNALVIVWGFSRFMRAVYNLKTALRAKRQPEHYPFTTGIVLNAKTRKLEKDSSPLLPF